MADDATILKRTYLLELVGTERGINELIRDVKRVDGLYENTTATIKKFSQASKGLGIDIAGLAARAAITIPIWLAMRSAFMGVLDAFNIGIIRTIEMSKALAKAQTTAFDAIDDFDAFKRQVKDLADALGRELGENAVSTVKAFERLVSAGLSVEEALAATEATVRASNIAQLDATDIADEFASTFAVFGDTLDKTLPVQERFALAFAKINALEKDTVVTLKGLAEGFNKVGQGAARAGLTFDETLVSLSVLNTVGVKNAQAGTLLSTALNKLTSNTDQLKTSFGIIIPEGQRVFESFRQILNLIAETVKRGDIVEAQRQFEEIFGGEKGSKAAGGIAEKIELFNELLDRLNTDGPDGIEKIVKLLTEFNIRGDIATSNLENQIKRFREINVQGSEAWINNTFHLDKFSAALERVNDLLEESLNKQQKLNTARNKIIGDALTTIPGPVSTIFGPTNIAKNLLETLGLKVPGLDTAFSTAAEAIFARTINKPLKEKLDKENEKIKETIENSKRDLGDISKPEGPSLPGGEFLSLSPRSDLFLRQQQIEVDIARRQANFATGPERARENLRDVIEKEATNLDLLKGTEGEINELRNARKIETFILNDQLEEAFKLISTQKDREEVINKIIEARIKLIKEENKELDEIRSKLGGIVKSGITDALNGDENMFINFGNRLKAQVIDSVAEGLTQAFLKSAFSKQLSQSFLNLQNLSAGQGLLSGGGGTVTTSHGIQIPANAVSGGGGFGVGNIGAFTAFMANPAVLAAIVGVSVVASRHAENKLKRADLERINTTENTRQIALDVRKDFGSVLAGGTDAQARLGQNGRDRIDNPFSSKFQATVLGLNSKAVLTRLEEFRIASRIEQSNKHLENINRNLVALRQELTFILPQSAYFSETRNNSLEDNFSLAGRRGYVG